jgi:beta-lactam-binding protein with PASTA domain
MNTSEHQTVAVPNLVGMSKGRGKRELKKIGLVASAKPHDGPTRFHAEGQIIATNPAAGEHVAVGSTVTIRYRPWWSWLLIFVPFG